MEIELGSMRVDLRLRLKSWLRIATSLFTWLDIRSRGVETVDVDCILLTGSLRLVLETRLDSRLKSEVLIWLRVATMFLASIRI